MLLRGQMTMTDLMATIREVKAQVPEPVTYADVWEFWLRYRDVADAVDFVTIHILPYWEDFPLPASIAAAHVAAIREKVALAIPNKQVVIGEVGWPSAGRMREGARPSPSNQAKVILQTLATAQLQNFQVNVIEAFDQPWKRRLEGSVGGAWGIFDRATGAPKFSLAGGGLSDHPQWRIQALAGVLLAAFVFGAAWGASKEKTATRFVWLKVAMVAILPAILFGWTIEMIAVDSFSPGGWLRSLALAATAATAPVGCAIAVAAGRPLPSFAALLGGGPKPRDALTWILAARSLCLSFFRSRRRSVWYSSRAIATFHSRRYARPCCRSWWCWSRHRARPVRRLWPNGLPQSCWRLRRSTSCSTKALPIGRRCGSPLACSVLPSLWRRRGTRQADNDDTHRQGREIDVMQHQTETGRRDRQCHQYQRGVKEMEQRGGKRQRAE